jgi:methyltransferase-like protein
LQAYLGNALELHAFEPSYPDPFSECPEALPMARLVAQTARSVPSLRHRPVNVSDFEQRVLRSLNGRNSHRDIIDLLMGEIADGPFTLNRNGLPIRDPEVVRPILERSLGPALERLNRSGLLVH